MGRASASQALGVTPAPARVLFVMTEPEPRLALALTALGVGVGSAPTALDALHQLEDGLPTCVVIDLDAAGAEPALDVLQSHGSPARVAVMASASALFVAMKCWAARRAQHVLMKPPRLEELLALVEPSSDGHGPRLPSIERVQWEYIHAVLGSCDGNVSEAARQLGMYRQSLQRMLRRHPPRQ
jgi:two-component system, response regulator RegA